MRRRVRGPAAKALDLGGAGTSSEAIDVERFTAATGGSLCIRYPWVPSDFSAVVTLARNLSASVQLMICGDAQFDTHPFLVLPAPIRVPSLVTRSKELPRIVDEFVIDALKGARR